MQAMHVDGAARRRGPRTESEYVVDAGLRLAAPVAGRLALTGEVRRRVMLTHTPVHHTHVALGAAWVFATPRWLARILE
jgi:hypothetical protein